jgi:hypothetical protein
MGIQTTAGTHQPDQLVGPFVSTVQAAMTHRSDLGQDR